MKQTFHDGEIITTTDVHIYLNKTYIIDILAIKLAINTKQYGFLLSGNYYGKRYCTFKYILLKARVSCLVRNKQCMAKLF